MARARSGGKVQKTLSFLIYGEKGTWKSSLALQLAKMKRADKKAMRVLILDAEFGGLDYYLEDLEKEGINLNNIYIVYTESYSEIMDYLEKVKNRQPLYHLDDEGNETEEMVLDAEGNQFTPDAIILDGSTVVYNALQIALTKFSEKRASVRAKTKNLTGEEKIVAIQGAGLELKDYNKLNKEKSQELILKLISTGCHHVVTARETDEKKSVADSEGKTSSVPTGRKIAEGFKQMEYNVGTVLRTYVDEYGTINAIVENKDRTGVHMQNEVIPEPSLLDWEIVIHNDANKPKLQLQPTFGDAIEKEYNKEVKENEDMIGEKMTEDSETPEFYYQAIADAINKLTPVKKRTLKTAVQKEELPLEYKTLTDLIQLKKYLQIVTQ